MPQSTEQSLGMVQINSWLEKIRRWLLLCNEGLLMVVLVTAGSEVSINMVNVGSSLGELLSLLVQLVQKGIAL